MNPNTFPTKGNLILAKNTLKLSKQGFDLMDKKRNILIQELMDLIAKAQGVQAEINITFNEAYAALQRANIEMGVHAVEQISFSIPKEKTVQVKVRSIMGVEIPLVTANESKAELYYGFAGTSSALDHACEKFSKVKNLTIKLATIENSAYRLADSIKKTQKRANALKNITIPYYEKLAYSITNSLEEKEREEFTRLKVIKNRRNN